MKNRKNLAILILAAGNSSRLGEPKQLVKFKGQSLLFHTCKKAKELSDDVFVVLGANSLLCKKEIQDLNINTIENENYIKGLSSSLSLGISKLLDYEKVLILLCDQPLIPILHLKELIYKANENNKIICSFYKNDVAVPAIFPKVYYSELLSLKGDKGAKSIIKKNKHDIISLDDNLAFDIDTKEDKKYLQNNSFTKIDMFISI